MINEEEKERGDNLINASDEYGYYKFSKTIEIYADFPQKKELEAE